MFYRSTRVRKNILAPRTIARVILCFGVCKVTLKSSFQIRLILKIKFFSLSLSCRQQISLAPLEYWAFPAYGGHVALGGSQRDPKGAHFSLMDTEVRLPGTILLQHLAQSIQNSSKQHTGRGAFSEGIGIKSACSATDTCDWVFVWTLTRQSKGDTWY